MKRLLAYLAAALLLFAVGSHDADAHSNSTETTAQNERWLTSYYGEDFDGKLTANGERFDMAALTAAHRTLPFNTLVRVTNPDTEASVVVRINDRGPFRGNRKLDLSQGAAEAVGMIEKGVMVLEVEVLD